MKTETCKRLRRPGGLIALAALLTTLAYLPLWLHWGELPLEPDWLLEMHGVEGIRRCIANFGEFPWWNPWHNGGMPSFASPGGVISFETLFALCFGTHQGLLVLVWFYLLFGIAGMYLWSRNLGFSEWSAFYTAAMFGLQGTFALHFQVGHLVMGAFAFLPWLCWCARGMPRGIGAGVGFGVLASVLCLQAVHYMAIMAGVCFGGYFLWLLRRERGNRIFWRSLAGAAAIFITLCGYRLVTTFDFCSQFPREMADRYMFSPWLLVRALIEPFQLPTTQPQPLPGMWNWHELGCYIGVIALIFFAASLKKGIRFYHVFALLSALLVWDTASHWMPGYYLRELPLFKSLFVFTRWRFFMVFFLLTGAGAGLDMLQKRFGWKIWIAAGISIGAVFVSDFMQLRTLQWEKYDDARRGVKLHSDTIVTTRDFNAHRYITVRQGVSVPRSFDPIFGYTPTLRTGRIPCESPAYRGEVVSLEGNMTGCVWSPNRLVFELKGPDVIYVNQNVSDYWRFAGKTIFPKSPSVEFTKPFLFRAGGPGKYELYTLPPQHELGCAVTGAGALLLLCWGLLVSGLGTRMLNFFAQSTERKQP